MPIIATARLLANELVFIQHELAGNPMVMTLLAEKTFINAICIFLEDAVNLPQDLECLVTKCALRSQVDLYAPF